MVLRQTLEQDVVGLGELGVVQQVGLGDGEQQLDKRVEGIVQRLVPIQPKMGFSISNLYGMARHLKTPKLT